jgi:predicted O-methyltransferase YrrM
MSQHLWAAVDADLAERLATADDALAASLAANAAAGLPAIDVSPLLGKLLHLLARGLGARKVLEIGTLGGYSTIWLARALPSDGKVITLELEPEHAAIAKANIDRAGLSRRVEIRIGPAAETLAGLKSEGAGPFDLIFIDADKTGYPDYLKCSLELSRPGTLIIADNVVRGGAIADAASTDPNVLAVRRFLDMLAAEPRLSATAIQTVGKKGYDGFAIAIVGQH